MFVMIELINKPVLMKDAVKGEWAVAAEKIPANARENTMGAKILKAHNQGDAKNLALRFDGLTSHDITAVGVIQTAIASGMTKFNLPYILTNCHNSLCATGGTINADDHIFALSAAKRFGGVYLPPHQAVMHQYMRETRTFCGGMLLGSDSHTRYGALGTMGIGEGGPELVKQLLGETYNISAPKIIAVNMQGAPNPAVGPMDVALAIIGAVFKNGFVKNAVLEFVGSGIGNLSVDYRCGVDVMMTETTCLSTIWRTDTAVKRYFEKHGRPESYQELTPGPDSLYDGMIMVDLDKVEPMIALPFHPSNTYTIKEFLQEPGDILRQVERNAAAQLENKALRLDLTAKLKGKDFLVEQAVVVGCSGGTFENIAILADILKNSYIGNDNFELNIYPSSQPVLMDLTRQGYIADLLKTGATVRTAFCGPCFGAGDTPANGALSIRHATRNFPFREGAKPTENQIASVALMDARSIAATAKQGGRLANAMADPAIMSMDTTKIYDSYHYDADIYAHRVYNGYGHPQPEVNLVMGPGIAMWPTIRPLPENLLIVAAAVINDEVTTTDELIPSGETSALRSNPLKLANYTLSRKAPQYVTLAKQVQKLDQERGEQTVQFLRNKLVIGEDDAQKVLTDIGIGSLVVARRPGDGSAREQAASCQRVLGGAANIALEYATKRYRSNLINWGMLPFTIAESSFSLFEVGDCLYLEGIREKIKQGAQMVEGVLIKESGSRHPVGLKLLNLTTEEREVILSGCLINFYRGRKS
jgi:aconitate hydratase